MDEPPLRNTERRRHPRYDLIAQVRVSRGRRDIVMELSNISISGALLDMGSIRRPGWVAVDREIEVGIVHPVDLDTVEVIGRVVRIVEDHAGVRFAVDFTHIDDAARTGLKRLVALAQESRPLPPPLPSS